VPKSENDVKTDEFINFFDDRNEREVNREMSIIKTTGCMGD